MYTDVHSPETGALAPQQSVPQAQPELLPLNLIQRLQQDAAQRTALPPPISHEQVLARLLDQVQPIDFYTLAGLNPDRDKVNTPQYVVLVVEQVLVLAKQHYWGLSYQQGFLYTFNGSYWKKLEEAALERFLREAAERMGVPHVKASFHGFVDHLHSQFLTMAAVPSAPANKEMVLANLRNGTFEIGLDIQQLRDPDPADFLTHELPFSYDPQAMAPRWQAFLDKVVPDVELQRLLAEFLAYVFIPSRVLKLEKVLLLYGTGANGKSVFFEVVTALLGPENVSNYSLNSLTQNQAYSRAHLGGKLVNYASEMSGKLEVDTFKQLASGEPIEARLPYGQPFVMTDYAKLIFNTNEMPAEVEHTHAFFRRFLIVPFRVTIPEAEQDRNLANTIIREELSGVFNWILDGLHRLLAQQSFSPCEAANRQLDTFKRESDTVRLFLDDQEYEPCADQWIATSEVYQQYRHFCLDNGHSRPVARLKFVARLQTNGVEEKRRNTGKALGLLKRTAW